MFNTNTLGYKLVTGKLKETHKHSEQLCKYIAGLFDSDGYIGLEFIKDSVYLRGGITQSATVDTDFRMLRSVKEFFNLGTLYYHYQDNNVSCCSWRFSTKDAKLFYNRVGKHLRIKATHFLNLINKYNEIQTKKLSTKEREELQSFSKDSRSTSLWLKRPKHLSYAWVAGYLDGDGCYRIRRKDGKIISMCVKAASHDLFILDKLKEDFNGSINVQDKNSTLIKCWRRGLGKGHIKFAIPFLLQMQQYSCIENKYNKIQEMLKYLNLTSRND